jgi:LysM domain-containing protein/cysteine-rich secretory family protein
MDMRLRCLIIFILGLTWILPFTNVLAGPLGLPSLQEETSTPTPSVPSPADIIDAVNNLRIQHGLNPLSVHDVLMEIAAQQANALAATQGAIGHERPCGMSLGQELLLKGFPLWGDLSQDGYRSENWGTAKTAEETISMWLGDDEHTNTMLSEFRSDIGVAVAVSDQIYIVLETALRTNSGKMQGTAYDILTGIPMTQATCLGWSTQMAEYGNLSQYSIPVVISTARPDGDVIHEVKYGQALWSIAIQYGTTIEQIKRLNNLSDDIVVPGWKLLVQKGATQPASFTIPSPEIFEAVKQKPYTPTPQITSTPVVAELNPSLNAGQFMRQNSVVVVAFVISFSVLIAGIAGFGKKR